MSGRSGRPEKKFRRDKVVVEWNEDARHEYLTGFHKRKNERRKVAAHAIAERAKEDRRSEKAELRAAVKAQSTTVVEYDVPVAAAPAEAKRAEFADDFSRAAFGAASVVVTTQLGLGGEEEEEEDEVKTDRLRELAAPFKAAAALKRKREEEKAEKARADAMAGKKKKKRRPHNGAKGEERAGGGKPEGGRGGGREGKKGGKGERGGKRPRR